MTAIPAKTSSFRSLLIWAALALLPPVTLPASAAPASFVESLQEGKVSLDLRLRALLQEQVGFIDHPYAIAARPRLGYETPEIDGWRFAIEGEDIQTLAHHDTRRNDIVQFLVFPSAPIQRYSVAERGRSAFTQLQLAKKISDTTVVVGRQRLLLDNGRFVGDNPWELNLQTLDAATIRSRNVKHITLTYSYIWQRNNSSSGTKLKTHLVNASYDRWKPATIVAYAYLLEYPNFREHYDTIGGHCFGSQALSASLHLTYRFEYASQRQYHRSPFLMPAPTDKYRYRMAELGLSGGVGAITLGCEEMSRGRGSSFITPLANHHDFGGWAGEGYLYSWAGKRDIYLKSTASLRGWGNLQATLHYFEIPDRRVKITGLDNRHLGTELDCQFSRTLGKHVIAAAKVADFNGYNDIFDVRKLWLQLDYSY